MFSSELFDFLVFYKLKRGDLRLIAPRKKLLNGPGDLGPALIWRGAFSFAPEQRRATRKQAVPEVNDELHKRSQLS